MDFDGESFTCFCSLNFICLLIVNITDKVNMKNYLSFIIRDFKKYSKINTKFKNEQILVAPKTTFDGQLVFSIGNTQLPYWVRLEKNLGEEQFKEVKHLSLRYPNLLIIGKIKRDWKYRLKEEKIAFIAEQGDYYLPLELSSSISSKNKSLNLQGNTSKNLLTSSKGMIQLVFSLLSDKELIQSTQREIAKKNKLSLGVVNRYLLQLENHNYIKDNRFLNYPKLLNHWVADFDRYFLPKIRREKYSPIHKNILEKLRTEKVLLKNGYWGATKGAGILFISELPKEYLIYTDKISDLIIELKLRPDPQGPIELRERFWNFDWKEKKQNLVPLPLVYADLMLSSDSRDHNLAKKLEIQINENT